MLFHREMYHAGSNITPVYIFKILNKIKFNFDYNHGKVMNIIFDSENKIY